MRLLVFPYAEADGPANMALDQAMLEAVADEPSCALFRTYGWTVPTLSLGYFQRLAEADADPRWRLVPMVRRPTGGGALWHAQELTYALAVPRGHPMADQTQTLYQAVHEAIGVALRSVGIEAARRGGEPTPGIGAVRPFLCFTGHDREDIVCGRAKLVGSAQRRRVGAVLQHGALLLARSPKTPDLAGASDLMAAPKERWFWQDQFEREIPWALGLKSCRAAVPGPLQVRARALEVSVYRNVAWTARR